MNTRSSAPWEHLLWFAHALVYHAREQPEREPLADYIRETVRKREQPEVQIMGKTIAEALQDEGELRGKRETLLRLLKLKFKRVPAPSLQKSRARRTASNSTPG